MVVWCLVWLGLASLVGGFEVSLFRPGDGGYKCYKIPGLVRTTKGTLIATIEARKFSCNDHGYIDLVARRSTDGGHTWGPSVLIYSNSTSSDWKTVGNAAPVQDKSTGRIHLPFTIDNWWMMVTHSDDEGVTWSTPRNITSATKGIDWTWVGNGLPGGIQLSSGRLLVPGWWSKSNLPFNPIGSIITEAWAIYSDDGGKTWISGQSATDGNECQAVSLGGEDVLLAMRSTVKLDTIGYRLQSLSKDGGLTWGQVTVKRDLPAPLGGCQGSIIGLSNGTLLFSNPDGGVWRVRLDVHVSHDKGDTWHRYHTVWPKAAGYSAMQVLDHETVGIFYDRSNKTSVVFEASEVTFATFTV